VEVEAISSQHKRRGASTLPPLVGREKPRKWVDEQTAASPTASPENSALLRLFSVLFKKN
jgi:hypothetical protein